MSSSAAFSPSLPQSQPVLRWGAIFAGGVVAVGLLLTLYSMGLGCGFAAINPEASGRMSALVFFTGAFGAMVPLLALFVGGYVASRSAGVTDQVAGLMHGLTVWGITALGLIWLMCSLVGTAVSSTAAVGSSLARVGGAMASGMGDSLPDLSSLPGTESLRNLSKKFDLDVDSLLEPINKKLQHAHKPPIKAAQIKAATETLTQRAMREGKLDLAMVTQAVVDKTSVSKEDAQSIAEGVVKQFDEAKAELQKNLDQAKEQFEEAKRVGSEKMQQVAQDAAEGMSKAFWGIFMALAYGMAAACVGAVIGVRNQ